MEKSGLEMTDEQRREMIAQEKDALWQKIVDSIQKSGRNYDLPRLEKAFNLAFDAHGIQIRKSGRPFIEHPVEVAVILIEFGMDSDTVAAAILHDVVEDTGITLAELRREFDQNIAYLVDGVTKLGKIQFSSKEEEQAENVRKMLIAMAEDVRVIIIKLADRLHNMRTIRFVDPQKQRDKALETMEVYAPIAHRLGIRTMKDELEDISLHCLDPVAYEEIERALSERSDEREKLLGEIIQRINDRMKEESFEVYLAGRVKSIYGIYRKVFVQGRSFEEIYDIFAIRIIVDTAVECYNCLGVIHDMMRPIPSRFKDYISTPKANMYQSLHTTVIDKEGIPFEVQIRTWEMHQTAEFGIAAHWKYKVGIQGRDRLEERMAWVRQLLEAQQDSDMEDIVSTIKSDLSPEEVYVFTPKGDVKNLPSGSTVIDFAYSIHSAVGNRMNGAKIDGRIVPLDTKVKTGQIVEIITTNAQGHGPSRDWLKIVQTSEARNKIRAWFKRERREENIQNGKDEFDRELRRNLITLTDAQYQEFVGGIAKRQNLQSIEELYAAVGYGGVMLSRIMPRIKDEYNKAYRQGEPKTIEIQQPKKVVSTSHDVVVEGIDNCLVKFARCCNPLPGDEIVGFVTRGYGVSVHKGDCVNVQGLKADPEQLARFINVHWSDTVTETFKATVELTAEDRDGLLAAVSIQLANMRLAVYELNARKLKGGLVAITITLGAGGLDHLRNIIAEFQKIGGVLTVERTTR